MKYFWLVLVFLFGVVSADAAKLKLAYSMNLNGEIGPCGCATASDHGGLLRRASWHDQK